MVLPHRVRSPSARPVPATAPLSVVAAYLYREGKRQREVSLDEAVCTENTGADFVWIGLFEPTADELAVLARNYGLHPLAVEDALNGRQISKLDVYGDQLFVVAKTAHLDGDRITYGSTAIFIGKSFIITVRHGSARAHSELRQQLEITPGLLREGTDYILHAVLDFIVDGYFPIVESIEEKVVEMEQSMLAAFLTRQEVTRIFTLRRELLRFQRVLGPMLEVCSKLVNLNLPGIDDASRPYFRDVLDHMQRAESTIDGIRDILISVFEVSHLLEQQRQGAITRQLAAWAAILAVPTAIAGIYGMNFENMPELKTQWGYFVVIGVILSLCVGLFIRFKASKWL